MGYERDEQIRKLMREWDSAKGDQHKVVKLPCCGTSVEILRPEDQILWCPQCAKRHALIWQRRPKLQSEAK